MGKEFHWVHVLDTSGRELLSRKLENDEPGIIKLIDKALCLAEEVVWAVDQTGGSAALFLLALLWERDQRVLYTPGLAVNRASDTYRGESKTDARDGRVIADQARMRLDLSELEPGEEEEVAQLYASCSDAAISLSTRTGPLPASERRSCCCLRLWSERWI